MGRTANRSRIIGPAKLLVLAVFAVTLILAGEVIASPDGPVTITVTYPTATTATFTWDNPNNSAGSSKFALYKGTCGVAAEHLSGSGGSFAYTLNTSTWAAGAVRCFRVWFGTASTGSLDTTYFEFTVPGTLQSYTPGTPAVSEFAESGDGRGTATVFVPVTDASAGATDVALAWTVSPAPADWPTAFYTTLTASERDGTVGVVFNVAGLLVYTAYTVTVKLQGAADSTAGTLTYEPLPEHLRFPAPGILTVSDETPDNDDTASLQVTWSGAPAAPVTGFWLRYNEGFPLTPNAGQEKNIVRRLPPISRTVGTVEIEVLAYYGEDTEVTYQGRDQTVPTGDIWFSIWSKPYTINISRPSEAGEYVPPKEAAPLVVETFEQLLPVMGIPAEHAPNYALLFLFFLTVGVGGFLYVTTGGGAMSAALGGMAAVIIWSGLGWWWFGLPVPMALVPVVIIILGGGTIVTSRVLA